MCKRMEECSNAGVQDVVLVGGRLQNAVFSIVSKQIEVNFGCFQLHITHCHTHLDKAAL